MSSQRQWHKLRKSYKNAIKATEADNQVWKMLIEENDRLHKRVVWLENYPPWWKFWAVRQWREEEPE